VETCGHIQLIEQVVQQYRSDRWLLIEDNLSIHTSQQTRLALTAWPEIQVQLLPKYAPWLNLIEPWLKQLRSRALKGRRFASTEEREQALRGAVADWNAHPRPYRWKKRPQQQVVLDQPAIDGRAPQ
jgi:transposase